MKITDVKVHALKPLDMLFQWKEEWPPKQVPHNLVRVITDEGIEGDFITWLATPWELKEAIEAAKPALIGRDPWDREAIWHEMSQRSGPRPSPWSSSIDICLWDIAGKKVGLPIYKLLGAYRDKIRAYASTVMYPTVQEFVDLALKCREEGFNAFKLHAYGVPDKDIEVCRAVREAVGDTMDLMLDPVNAYDRRSAFEVGRVLEELKFYWYEAPIPDTDIDGYVDLTRSLDIQISGTEGVFGGLTHYPQYITRHAVDSIRSVGDMIGGISAMMKSAGLCEAFGINYEPHSYGTTLVQAAHLHVMLAIKNCDLFELPVPQGIMDIGMKDVIRVTKEGCVEAPTKPGLGYDIDWDKVRELTVEEF